MSITHRVKRLLGVGLAGAMIIALFPAGIAAADAIDTDDVEACEGSEGLVDFNDTLGFFESEIECMAAFGITVGDAEGNFNSGGTVTRQQMALFIARTAAQALEGDPEAIPESTDDAFDDIANINPPEARDAINWLYDLEITTGVTPDTFDPSGTVTRQAMASFVARAHVALGVDLPDPSDDDVFTDTAAIAAVHQENVLTLHAAGVVEGTADGSYAPAAAVTRGQMSAFIVRSIGVLEAQDLWNGVFVVDPDEGVAPSVTEAPDLVGVAIVSDDATRTQVHYTFDDDVQPVGLTGDNFFILGWNGAQIQADDVRRLDQVEAGGATNVIRAAFLKGAGGYINGLAPVADTVPRVEDIIAAGVDQAAVLGLDSDIESPERAISLGGAQVPGDFQYAPSATEVTNISSSQDRLDIVFSRNIALEAGVTGDEVTIYLGRTVTAGGVTQAATIESLNLSVVSNNTLRVDFGNGNLTGTDANNIRVVAIDAGTVEASNDSDAQNNLQTLTVAQGGATADPDLTGVSLDYGNDRATFTFSEAIEQAAGDIDETLFQLHYAGSSATAAAPFEDVASGIGVVSATTTSATIQFEDGAVTKDITRAGAAEGAVEATDGTNAPNPTRTLGISQSFGGLETIGPDLQEVIVEVTQRNPIDDEVQAYAITYVFDTVIDDAAGDVSLYAEDGSSASVAIGDGVINAGNRGWNTITFTAGNDAADDFQLNVAIDAVAATIAYNAVEADDTTQRANLVNGKDGLGNYGQGINITPPS